MSIIVPNPPDSAGGFAGVGDELDIQRSLTLAFIDTQPVMITLVPRIRTKQPAGGYVYVDQPPRDNQTMRLVESSGAPIMLQGSDGVEREMEMMLLGRWDAIIGKFDKFTVFGRSYEVAGLYFPNMWEQRAQVIRFG